MLKKTPLLIGLTVAVIIGAIISISVLPSEKNISDSTHFDKVIPNAYDLGNFFGNDLHSGMTSTSLEQGSQKASIRFTNSITGKVNNVTLAISSNDQQQVIVGLQDDDENGNPTGVWINDKAINQTTISKGLDNTFTFPESVLITANKTYHIVIESENANKTNNIRIKNYYTNTSNQPYNPDNPDIYLADPSINSLFFDGTKWIEEDKWPAFLVSFADGEKIGQPYTLAAGWVIRDKTWVGQTFVPSSDYNISKISFVVSKEGDPDHPLFYGIQDSENNILSNGFFTESKQLSLGQNLIEISLDQPVFFESGELYRVYLYSTIPKEEEFYRIYGHEYSFDYDVGYGGLRHTLTISHDFGQTWSPWKDADTIFRLN
jgi:hypothetical protein